MWQYSVRKSHYIFTGSIITNILFHEMDDAFCFKFYFI